MKVQESGHLVTCRERSRGYGPREDDRCRRKNMQTNPNDMITGTPENEVGDLPLESGVASLVNGAE